MTRQDAVSSPLRESWLRFRRNRAAWAALWFLAAILLAVIVGPFLSPYTFAGNDLALGASGPSLRHWMGTDDLGRDYLTRILYGGRVSFSVGLCATAVSLLIGVAYGAAAGYFGGWVDSLLMRVVDILSALPFTVFVILLMVFFGHEFILLFAAIGAVSWLTMARIVRAQVQGLKKLDFISAALATGASPARIVFRHLLPNVAGPVIAYATLTVPGVMMLEAFLSFIGLGVQPPMSSWGSLISDGAKAMEEYPTALVFPCLVFSLTLFALNFLGDGLRDAFDPKESGR